MDVNNGAFYCQTILTFLFILPNGNVLEECLGILNELDGHSLTFWIPRLDNLPLVGVIYVT